MKTGVYILRCSDGSFYTGATKNLTQRIKRHRLGKAAKYTRSRLPVRIVYWESHQNYPQALKREIEIKKMSRLRKENLIMTRLRRSLDD